MYQVSRTWSNSSDLIALPTVSFQGVKKDDAPLSGDVLNAWNARKGKTYVLISEPYDSFGYTYQNFGLAIPAYQLTISINPSTTSFWRGMRITGVNTAENEAEVPISGSTNVVDAVFTKDGDTEYISLSNGLVYRSVDGMETLDKTATVKAEGQAMWYRVDDDYEITYSIPENCAIAVYDKSLTKMDFTTITDEDTFDLEEGYYIAFIGNGEFVPQ